MPSKKLTESQKIMRNRKKLVLANLRPIKDGEQLVTCTPAFEARDPDPSKDYGIGGVQISFAERRGDLVIECSFFTDWYLPETQEKLSRQPRGTYYKPIPLCNGIYWHYPKKTNEYQYEQKECILSGGSCYGEAGSALYAEKITERLLREGAAGVWAEIDQAFKEADK